MSDLVILSSLLDYQAAVRMRPKTDQAEATEKSVHNAKQHLNFFLFFPLAKES